MGDHIEVAGNRDCLRAAAEMFDWDCGFFDSDDDHLAVRALARSGLTILALENTSGADNLFTYRPPGGPLAMIVGNERRGISRSLLRLADRVIQIPIASAHINTINVAAAAAVAMYRLSRAHGARSPGHGRGRPEVLLAGATDAIELGSAVRSAASFGWAQLFIDDRHATWFAADRVTRSLGRGAARRARNPIRVLPVRAGSSFDEVCVVRACGGGEPLHRTDLAGGPRQLVVIPDEAGDIDTAALAGLGHRVREVRLDVACERPRFRLMSSIVLAEVARQVGGWRTVARRS